MLQLALQDSDILKVVAPSRRPLSPHAKLENPIVRELGVLTFLHIVGMLELTLVFLVFQEC